MFDIGLFFEIFFYYSQDIAKVEASIDTFSKQMEVYRTDKERWMERFKDQSIYLDKLQKEAEQTVCLTRKIIQIEHN